MSDGVARDPPWAAPHVLRGERPRAHRYVDPLHRRSPQVLELRGGGGQRWGLAGVRYSGEVGFRFLVFPLMGVFALRPEAVRFRAAERMAGSHPHPHALGALFSFKNFVNFFRLSVTSRAYLVSLTKLL